MTRGIAETRRRLVEWPLKYDAHTWPRSADRRTLRPTGRGEYGYNRVQEIVSGTRLINLLNSAMQVESVRHRMLCSRSRRFVR